MDTCIKYKPANGDLINFFTDLAIFNMFTCQWQSFQFVVTAVNKM